MQADNEIARIALRHGPGDPLAGLVMPILMALGLLAWLAHTESTAPTHALDDRSD